jgi:predicted RNA-binding Zn-ribbon protein involved in translation (DUF1610 family)
MPDLITLTCPSCGAKLKVTDQIHLLVCRNCGNEHMVVRDMSSIYLAPIAQDVRGIRVGVDKTAAELAVARLSREIDLLETELAQAETSKPDEWIPASDAEKFFNKAIPVTGALAFLGLITSSPGFALFMGIAFLISIFATVAIHRNRMSRARTMQQYTIQRLTTELSPKYEQYRKNRQIAES